MGFVDFIIGLVAFGAISVFIQTSTGGSGDVIAPVEQLTMLLSGF